ncbi:hypothetical protein ACA910_015945 [Epithemia clementina (nom. ined.)]
MLRRAAATLCSTGKSTFGNANHHNQHKQYAWFSSLVQYPTPMTRQQQRRNDNVLLSQYSLATSTTMSCIMGSSPLLAVNNNHNQVGAIRTLIAPPMAFPPRRALGRRSCAPSSRRRPSLNKGSTNKPSLKDVHSMPTSVQEMHNSTLVILGELGEHDARIEILKRHIMATDKVSYDEACETFKTIEAKNQEGQYLLSLPYQVGIAAALSAAIASFPLCFHQATAEWFNERYVTTDVPESEDLETWLEVGAWTWNWMEPPLGQISFVLLCLQFSRNQLENLGIKPYTKRIKRWRAEHLAGLFPEYDSRVIMNYSESSGMISKS